MNRPTPNRIAALEQLKAFLPRTGRDYAARRNYDLGAGRHDGVSCLSPYLRHRLVLEQEVIAAVTARFSPSTAEKFIAEVFWRTYFKGFLERRPTIWVNTLAEVERLQLEVERDGRLRADLDDAEAGRTGIDCFDAWARELVDTGYLHNHARMWFASIWIFTLRLPWELGADFFLRHLIDGDPASNTLSWRWVGGLHTKGKTYLARPDNIAKYTEGRFQPRGLAAHAEPLFEDDEHPLLATPTGDLPPDGPVLLVLTEEDGRPETFGLNVAATVRTTSAKGRSPHAVSADVMEFTDGVVADAAKRVGDGPLIAMAADPLAEAADAAGTRVIATPYCPVGPAATRWASARNTLEQRGYRFHALLRQEDASAWPHADRGFFKIKKAIPKLLPG